MNIQAIQKKLNDYMEKATPEQVVKELEDLGVEFTTISNILLEKQKRKTGLAMLNLFEYMVKETSDINWKQNLLSQIKDRQGELNTTTTTES